MNYLDKIIQENKLNREYEDLVNRRKNLINDSFSLSIKFGTDYISKLEEFNKSYLEDCKDS
jgi:hypothetical protein